MVLRSVATPARFNPPKFFKAATDLGRLALQFYQALIYQLGEYGACMPLPLPIRGPRTHVTERLLLRISRNPQKPGILRTSECLPQVGDLRGVSDTT